MTQTDIDAGAAEYAISFDPCILAISLNPTQRARVMGVPVRLRTLLVSAENPDGLSAALRRSD